MAGNEKAQILIVDDEDQMRSAMETVVARMGHAVHKCASAKEALDVLEKTNVDLIVSDLRMPEMSGEQLMKECKKSYPKIPFVIITAYGTITQAVEAMKEGAIDFITKPFSAEDLERVVTRVVNPTARPELAKSISKDRAKSVAIVTQDSGFRQVIEIVTTIAKSTASVMIQGESGTGKELIARLVHASSDRASGPFVAVNCAALPDNLLESELFGYEKGSFTGASGTKIGKFEYADGGTILLDEISEMAPALQAKLLRVLQEREIDRVGAQKPIPIDVRVVATTNRNLRESVAKGEFREDLYYRLNVVPIYMPALRERKGDVKLLIEHFVRKYSAGNPKNISKEMLQKLEEYSWPGNVRELQNACERAVLLSGDNELKAEHFLLGSLGNASSSSDSSSLALYSGLTVAEAEKNLIFETLRATNNNKTKAAELLGISIRTLRNKLNDYGGAEGEAI
jgi:DNA-binding NtrC family response regulator